MRSKLMMVVLLLAFSLGAEMSVYRRTLSLGKAQASALSHANFQQGQRVTIQFRGSGYSTTIQGNSIFGDGGCPNGGTSLDPNTPTLSAPYAYECKEEKLSGQAVLNFPSGTLAGTLDANGDLVLDAAVRVTGQVTITGEISRNIGGDNRRFLEVSGGCSALVRDVKQISLVPERWSVGYDCNLTRLSRATQPGTYSVPSVQVRYFGGRLTLTSGLSASYASGAPGTISLNPATLGFNTTLGSNPATQTVTLSNTGSGAMNWQAAATTSSGGNWLTVTPASGSLNAGQSATLTTTVNASALAAGSYNGTLTVSSTNASNSPRTVPVTLTVTGCATSFAATTAEPEQAQDTLQLANPMPGNDAPVSGALLKLGGFKVTARYLLQSRAGATLAVRLFDQDGNLRGTAGEVGVTRSASCPNPLPTREFVFSPASLDFTPKIGGDVPTSLTLSALFIDTATGGIFKRADLTYRVIPDVVAFESNPTINGKAAPDGSIFPADGKIKFDCGLRYHLTNDVRGKLRLEAFNFTGQSIARKDFAATVSATAQAVTVGFALDFEFTVPPTVSQITIAAALLAENGTVLKISVPLTYRSSGFGIALGTEPPGTSQFRPLQFTPTLLSGRAPIEGLRLSKQDRLALGVTEDLVTLPANTVAVIFLSARRLDGTYLRQNQPVNLKRAGTPTRPYFLISLPSLVPDDADQWELKLVFFPPGKDALFSKPLLLNIDRVRIVTDEFTPVRRTNLERGKSRTFRYKLEYNANRPGLYRLFAAIEYNPEATVPAPASIQLRTLSGGDHSPPNPPFSEFEVSIPTHPSVKVLSVFFFLFPEPNDIGTARSGVIPYNNLVEVKQLSSGATTVQSNQGVSMNGVQNLANRTLTLTRNATQFKGFLDANKLSLTEAEATADGARHFALRYAEAASLLRDFIGVNAYWEFDPPIPADGSFAANLTFSYDAEMLPDDPNLSEAALKVASFDPDTGQLVSYPTTVNTSAKTATARVNSLARFYTLGVFGPFAQRSLNFPVLQNGDDFTTRFNLVNAGTAGAALTLRAYDDAGTNLQAPNLVNPLTASLAAARMLTGSVSELFNSTAPLAGWVQTRANRNVVAGYEMLGSGSRLDGLNAPSGYDSALILPEAVYDANQTTEVHLANATNFAGLVQLELHDATGQKVGSEEVTLAPKARFAERLQDIFPNLAQPFTGYLLILSERDLAAAAVQVLAKEITALNAQPLGGGATKLYAPHVPSGGPAIARLTLVNPTAQAANLTLRLVNEPGAPVNAPINLTLGAGQQLQRSFGQLFTLNPLLLLYSTLVVESNVAGLAGNVTLLNPSGAIPFRATLPLESAPANRLVFAHFNTSDGFYTELSMFNPSAQLARVTLVCFKPDGASLGQTSVNVPAGTVFGDYLDNLVNGARGQAAGYFTLSSDQPILAGAAFGTDAGSALAALPPQTLPSTNTNALATVSAASFLGQTLAANSIVAAFGVNLANSVVIANQVPLPTTLADTIVEVRDSLGVERLAPLFFVAPGQINYLIPPGTANGAATATATNGAGAVSLGAITIANVAPGLFAATANGQGVAAAVALRIKANGAQSYETIARFDAPTQRFVSTPLDLGPTGEQVFLLLFGTGLRGRSSLGATTVLIGGVSAQVLYAGAQGDFVGLDQVNVAVPRALIGRGEVDLMLTVDGKAANTVRVNIK